MYGDTTVIRRLAAAMRTRAEDIRHLADGLVGRADHTPWRGRAADAMRRRVRDQATALRRSAGLHDDAADALDHHAAEVDRMKDLIASVERRVHHLVEAARSRLAGLAGRAEDLAGHVVGGVLGGLGHLLPDPVDQLLDRFVPPAHGSAAWLSVDLPGVRQ